MEVSELSESARVRDLPTIAALVAQPALRIHLERLAPADDALDPARSKDAAAILQLLARRGLDPDSLAWLLPQFDPLERSLISWDVLTSSVLKTDGELAEFRELSCDAAPIIGGAAKRGSTAAVVSALLPRFGDSAASTSDLQERAAKGELAAVVELRTRGKEFAMRARNELPRLRDRARLLARAHLPTLASLQLGLMWHVFDDRDALLEWIDVLADVDRFDALPSLDRLDSAARAYIDYRAAIAAQDPVRAVTVARAVSLGDGVRAAAVRVDVAIRTKRRDENAERALCAANAESSCRFAARVEAVARILAGETALTAVDRFLGWFGNDFDLWRDLAAHADRIADLPSTCEAIIARELHWLPHDATAWRALGLMLGEPASSAIINELDRRLATQSTVP
jgi:hypothetical protein